MRHFNVTYTMAFNKRYRRPGHLYQGRYHATVVERDSYLLELSRYFHLNPVRVKVVNAKGTNEAGSVLERYRWSSYRGYVHPRRREVFVDYSEVLEFFGGDTIRGRSSYARFVHDGIAPESQDALRELLGKLIVGTEEFVERLTKQFLPNNESARERPELRSMRKSWKPEDVLMAAAAALGCKTEHLMQRRRRTPERGLAMELLHRYCGLSQSEIGQLFGGLDYSSVSVNRKTFLAALEHDDRLRQTCREASEKLENQK
jgi:hypothetical protein